MDRLGFSDIKSRLTTQCIGQYLEIYDEIDSTNTRAAALARQGAPDGALILAECQTQGRGRLGRRWHAPAGSSLLMSLILRPELAPMQAQRVSMICSLAMVEVIADITGLPAQVKWPNDIVLRGKKLGGMLTELGARAERLDYVVVGLGLNVNLDIASLAESMTPPTSLSEELGMPTPRLDLLIAWLARVEAHYIRLRAGWSPREAWRGCLATLGQAVHVGAPEEVIEGIAEDVDDDGALLVRVASGNLRQVLVGDVTLRGHITRYE